MNVEVQTVATCEIVVTRAKKTEQPAEKPAGEKGGK